MSRYQGIPRGLVRMTCSDDYSRMKGADGDIQLMKTTIYRDISSPRIEIIDFQHEEVANAIGYFTTTTTFPVANSPSAKASNATTLEQPSAESVSENEIPLAAVDALPPPAMLDSDVFVASDVNQQTNEEIELHIVSKL